MVHEAKFEISRAPPQDVRVQRKSITSKRSSFLKRQGTLNAAQKVKNGLIDPAKKLSFASMQNSSFNLSFKNYNFDKPDNTKDDRSSSQQTETEQSSSSEWLEVIEKHNTSFGNTKHILGRLSSVPINKVGVFIRVV